jgi:hypothetical protein
MGLSIGELANDGTGDVNRTTCREPMPIDASDDVKWAIEDERAKVVAYLRANGHEHTASAIAALMHLRPRYGIKSTCYPPSSCERWANDEKHRCTDGFLP